MKPHIKLTLAYALIDNMAFGHEWHVLSSAFFAVYASTKSRCVDYHHNYAVDNGIVFG